jgi:hypothetical protein
VIAEGVFADLRKFKVDVAQSHLRVIAKSREVAQLENASSIRMSRKTSELAMLAKAVNKKRKLVQTEAEEATELKQELHRSFVIVACIGELVDYSSHA